VLTDLVEKETLQDFVYSKSQFESNIVNKATLQQKSYENAETNVNKVSLVDGKTYKQITARSPQLSNWFKTRGGPVYLEVGENNFLDSSETTD
jgi:hypothetical protein